MRMDFTIWISEEVLVLYFREERCLIMFRGLHSLVFNVFMWVDQLYLLFSVRPRIVVLLASGILFIYLFHFANGIPLLAT